MNNGKFYLTQIYKNSCNETRRSNEKMLKAILSNLCIPTCHINLILAKNLLKNFLYQITELVRT